MVYRVARCRSSNPPSGLVVIAEAAPPGIRSCLAAVAQRFLQPQRAQSH